MPVKPLLVWSCWGSRFCIPSMSHEQPEQVRDAWPLAWLFLWEPPKSLLDRKCTASSSDRSEQVLFDMPSASLGDLVVIWNLFLRFGRQTVLPSNAIQGTVQRLETHRTHLKHLQSIFKPCASSILFQNSSKIQKPIYHFNIYIFIIVFQNFYQIHPHWPQRWWFLGDFHSSKGGSQRSRRLQGNCASVREMPRRLMWDHWSPSRWGKMGGKWWIWRWQSQGLDDFKWFLVSLGVILWVGCLFMFFPKDHRLYFSSPPSRFTVMVLVRSCKGTCVVSLCTRPNNASNSWALL